MLYKASYFLIFVLIIGGVTLPFNPLLNGSGPASFIYYVVHCVLGLVLLNIVTDRRNQPAKGGQR